MGHVYRRLHYCENCYGDQGRNLCNKCKNVLDRSSITIGEFKFHKRCFVCNMCNVALAENAKLFRGELYCPTCYSIYAKSVCFHCGTDTCSREYFRLLGRMWGSEHMYCYACSAFIPKFKEGVNHIDMCIYCEKCHDKFKRKNSANNHDKEVKMKQYLMTVKKNESQSLKR